MWRVLIVVGLTVATAAGAEARGFRFSFRPRIVVKSRSYEPPFARKTSVVTTPGLPAQSILDAPGQVSKPTLPIAPAVEPKADQAAHWCDDGKVVGTGAGFCVLKAGNGES